MLEIVFVDFFRTKDSEFYNELKLSDFGKYNVHFINMSSETIPVNFKSGSKSARMFVVYTDSPKDFAFDLFNNIRKYQENPICILCSKTCDTGSVRSAFLAGFSDFIPAPFSAREVMGYASRLIRQSGDGQDIFNREDSPSELARNHSTVNEELVKGLVFSNSKITIRKAVTIKDMISTGFRNFAVANAKIVLDINDYFENEYIEITERHLEFLHQLFEDKYFQENLTFDFIQCVIDQKLCLVFFSKNSDCSSFFSEIETFIESVNEAFYSRTNYIAVVGLSSCFDNINKASNEYSCSILAIDQQFYSRSFSKTVFRYNGLSTLSDYDESEYEKIISKLAEQKGIESFYEVFEALLESFSEKNINAAYAKKTLMIIFNKLIYNNVLIANSAKNKIFFKHNIEKVVDNMLNAYEIIKYFARLINDLLFKTFYHRGVSNEIVEKAESIILNNYEKQITLTGIASELNINPNYLSELFKKYTGLNIISYITQIRIHKAKVLLANSDKKIYEIGNEVGYAETVSFNRAFKRLQGISPKAYRQNIDSESYISEEL